VVGDGPAGKVRPGVVWGSFTPGRLAQHGRCVFLRSDRFDTAIDSAQESVSIRQHVGCDTREETRPMASNSAPALLQAPGLAHAPTAAVQAEAPTVPAHMLPHRTPAQLLAIARQGLAEAALTRPDGLRYAAAHLAALRAAAAVLAARARPAAPTRRSKVTSVWSLLVLVAPEFADWAGYFALGATKRAAAEAGIPRVVSPREADDLLRAAEQFVAVVESSLGLSYQPRLAA
jgi:hypothetical protein